MDLTKRRVGLALIAVSLVLLITGVVVKNNFSAFSEKEIYVSPAGSDSNPGTISQPYLTVERARDYIRTNHLTGTTVYLRGGVYQQANPVSFTSADSGKSGSPNVYQAYSGEKPVIRGSVTLDQFSPYKGNIVVADLAALGYPNLSIPELYMNGDLLTSARTPNYTPPNFSAADPYAGDFLSTTASTTANKRTFYYDKSQLNPGSWSQIANAEVVIFASYNYLSDIRHIASVDTNAGTITLDQDTSYNITAGNHFYIRNIFQQLDSPGEWYFDAQTKKLYLYPPRTLTSSDRISVPISSKLITLTGAKSLEFRGLTFEEALNNAISVTDSSNIAVADCEIRNIEQDGIHAEGSAEGLAVERNVIHDVGSNGVYAFLNADYFKNLTPGGVIISNNSIYRAAKFRENASGINILSVGALVSHNEIHDLSRVGIVYRGNDNVVEYNEVYNVNQLTQDSGAIYMLGRTWLQRGNIVRNNFVHDTGGYALTTSGWRFNQFTWGIYLDDFTSGTKVYNNITARTAIGGFQIHSGRDNDIYNNVTVSGASAAQTWFQGWNLADTTADETMLSELNNMQANGYDRAKYFSRYPELSSIDSSLTTETIFAGNKFHQNIIYYPNNPSTDAFIVDYFVGAPGNASNNNVFWSDYSTRPIQVRDFHSSTHGSTTGRYTWEMWQGLGFDTSSVIADPKFVNPAQDNYTLQASSPALALGFQPIDQSKIGIEQSSGVVTDDSTNTSSYNSSSSSNGSGSNSAKAGTKKQTVSEMGSASVKDGSATGGDLGLDTQNQPPELKWYEKLRNWVVNIWGVSALWLKNFWLKWFR